MARFYANENFPRQVVEVLRSFEHDVLTVLESGKAGVSWPDPEVLAFATTEDRILLTHNRRHFRPLHKQRPNHAGIVLCTVDLDYAGLAGRIHRAVLETGDCRSRLLTVNRPNPNEGKAASDG